MGAEMTPVRLTLGAGQIDRVIHDCDALLLKYRDDSGYLYLNYKPITAADQIFPEDLAITLLMNSRIGVRAIQSLVQMGETISLDQLPDKPLENTTAAEREQVAALMRQLAQFPGFAASVATKLLHKKRPALIPILDNQAIFGAYMYPVWPQKTAKMDSVKDYRHIRQPLDWIAFDINRPENRAAWVELESIEPTRTRIELFDCVWWMYFRAVQPVARG
jgi:hypothetical protein